MDDILGQPSLVVSPGPQPLFMMVVEKHGINNELAKPCITGEEGVCMYVCMYVFQTCEIILEKIESSMVHSFKVGKKWLLMGRKVKVERSKQFYGSVRSYEERRFLKLWNAMKRYLNFDMNKMERH